jgi:hypothetical protein
MNFAALTSVEPADTGLASGLMNTAQRIGSGIGISALLAVLVARAGSLGAPTDAAALSAGFQWVFLGAAAFALLGWALALLVIQQPKPSTAEAQGNNEPTRARPPEFSFHH